MKEQRHSIKRASKCLVAILTYVVFSASFACGSTVYFADDFENGLDKWEVGGDAWQLTEAFFRSGERCISESPDGGYPRNANAAMTMKLQYFVDLSNSADPVLSFWHRIGVHNGDYGYVEISQDYGFTWTTIGAFTNTHRATWSWVQIDLTEYKTSVILIRFRLRDDGNYYYNALGWDIDDVEIREKVTETTPFPLFEDFENGFGNWQLGTLDAWRPTELLYRSAGHGISESPNGGYPRSACSDVVLARPIDLSSSVFPVLTFWHRVGLHKDDYAYVDLSSDGGTTWTELTHYTNTVQSNWTHEQLDLREYAAAPALIRFRLCDDGDYYYNQLGWDIDDIEIRELFYPPLDHSLIVQITGIDSSTCPLMQSTVLVTDVNGVPVGGLDASNFSVHEDDRLQTLLGVEPSLSDIVVSLALDYSASMSVEAIADMEAAALLFVDLMSAQDAGEVIKFARGVEVPQELTDDRAVLIGAVHGPVGLSRDATYLYQAVYQGISDIAEQPRSKAVIVISDGKNTDSMYGASQVIDYAESTGVSVFTIGLGSSVDEDVLRAIAVKTGGVYYYAPQSDDLTAIYEAIAGTLKNQYVLTYRTAACESDTRGEREHELEVTVDADAAYGQGAKRFTCPTSCDSGI